MSIKFHLNGKAVYFDVSKDTGLFYVLRNDALLNGPKFGCGLGQCGACTVLVDGNPVRSCILPVSEVVNKNVTTLEGLADGENLHPVQQAFIDEQAMQCGYCGNGMIMAAVALLENNPKPSDRDIINALEGHLCRCGTHTRILKAVNRAATELSGALL